MYLPPSSEAVCPSRGWPRPGETGGGRHRVTGHRGGERRGGGITVLWIDTSVRDCVARGARGAGPGVAMVTAGAASRGFTLEVMLESETEAGEEAWVSIMLTSGHSDHLLGFTLKDLIIHCVHFLLSHEEEKCSENFYNIPAQPGADPCAASGWTWS